MAQSKSKRPAANSRAATAAVLGMASIMVALCVALAAYSLGSASIEPGLAELKRFFPLAANAVCLLIVFALFVASTWHLLHELRSVRAEKAELVPLAMVATKTDNAVFLSRPNGVIQWVNEGFTRLTGCGPNEAVGREPGSVFLGQYQNTKITQKINDGIAQKRIITVEMFCASRRGHRYWISLNMTPVSDDSGQVTHFIGIGVDITARRRAEDEVAKVGRRSALFLNAAADGILGFDLQGTITFANVAACKLTGWSEEELVGKQLSTVLHQLRVARGNALQDELFAGAAFVEGTVAIGDIDQFRRRDGTPFPVEYTSTPVSEGSNLIGSVVVFRDITMRVESDTLRAAQIRQSALRAEIAFGLTNGDSHQAFLGCAMACLVKHLDGAFARVWTLNPWENMLELQSSAGLYTHVNGHHSRIPVGTLKVGKIARDKAPARSDNLLADPDVLDKEWVQRERMASFVGFPLFVGGELVGVMALYSRNPLPHDAMELMGSVSEMISQGIARAQSEGRSRQQAMILDFSKDAIVMMNLEDRILYWNKSAAHLYGWDKHSPAGRPAAEALCMDRTAYGTARANTLQNGRWRGLMAPPQQPEGSTDFESEWTLIQDADGRPGRILLMQTDVSALRRLEARVTELESLQAGPGTSSEFVANPDFAPLPAASQPTLPPPPPTPARGNGELVLVVDDEPSLLSLTRDTLESYGYRAMTATDGADAVATYAAHHDTVRLVITDMIMPNMDGSSTIRVLRRLNPELPILASSGMLDPQQVRDLSGLNDIPFLEKPYSVDTLLRSVERLIHRAP